MNYGYVASAVVMLHFLWVLFLIFGALWGRRNIVVKYVHITGLCVAFFIETANWICPLTHVEVWLRSRSNPEGGYTGSFIAHYLERLLYIDVPRGLIVALTVLLCAMNVYIYSRKK